MTNVLRARLRSISATFDENSKVELKFSVNLDTDNGELFLRIKASDALKYNVGDLYVAKLVKLP